MFSVEDLPPEPRLMESMRSVGYTLGAALADIVDNSISASSTEIAIEFGTSPEDFVYILDNGVGMSRETARKAMQLAGTSPLSDRDPNDLGRFGLGLKTASLSQCRDLCIVTIGTDGLVGLQWDLDHLAETGRWTLKILDDAESAALPGASELITAGRGTLVLWRKLDALRAQVGSDAGFDTAMMDAKSHLELVFHRFLNRREKQSITMRLNGRNLASVDPFLEHHPATVRGPEEVFDVEGSSVRVQAFTLPHLNKMKEKDKQQALLQGPMRDTQGFYVYRAKRLVIWGTWFRLRPREDLSKLTRVQVDIPNSLDHMWALDIKKSAAQPPPVVKQRLRLFGDRMVQPSRKTFQFRGRPQSDTTQRYWTLVEGDGTFRYTINRDHPSLQSIVNRLDTPTLQDLDRILALLEDQYPINDVYQRMLSSDVVPTETVLGSTDIRDEARRLWSMLRTVVTSEDFVISMLRTEPFNTHPEAEAILREESS